MALPKYGFTFLWGNMFGGKTSELGHLLNTEAYNGSIVQAFKASLDNRYGDSEIKTHNGAIFEKVQTFSVRDTSKLIELLNPETEIIGIDEVQFFDEDILNFIKYYSKDHYVFATGLKLDFRGNPFPLRGKIIGKDSNFTTADIASYATEIIHKPSKCGKNGGRKSCGEKAVYVQRFRPDGSLAPASDPTIVVGSEDKYSPRCEKHFVKPE